MTQHHDEVKVVRGYADDDSTAVDDGQDDQLMQQDEAVSARATTGSSIVLQIDKSVGKQFLVIIWISAVVTALSVAAMFIAYDAFRVTRQHVKILEYDLMDLRSKTGHAHENTE